MYIKIRVTTNAKEETVIKKDNETFLVSVKQKAERNMANRRVIELIAREFSIAPGKVRIVSGHHSPGKILSVDVDSKK